MIELRQIISAYRRLSIESMTIVNRWLKISQFSPIVQSCLFCQQTTASAQLLCDSCLGELPYIDTACIRCGLALNNEGVCGDCQKQSPAFDRAFALCHYEAPIDKCIQALKFQAKLHFARLLGEIMAKRLLQLIQSGKIEKPQCLIPVPIHWRRLCRRGFNQSLELARPISRKLSLPLEYKSVKRQLNTQQQAQLPLQQRKKNLDNAFVVRGKLDYQHVVILDDVMTSKQTAWQLARSLKTHGIKRVDVWVVARADLG